jgi:hypothetical protein
MLSHPNTLSYRIFAFLSVMPTEKRLLLITEASRSEKMGKNILTFIWRSENHEGVLAGVCGPYFGSNATSEPTSQDAKPRA